MQIEIIPIETLIPYKKNARKHPKAQIDLLVKNIQEFGFTTPILVDKDNNIIAGHGRMMALKQLGKVEAYCVRMEGLSKDKVKALRLADNQIQGMSDWDMDLVIDELKEMSIEMLDLTGFDKDLGLSEDIFQGKNTTLADRFLFPPFSVLNARSGEWQERKRDWLRIGIQSELGRGEAMTWGIAPSGSGTGKNKDKKYTNNSRAASDERSNLNNAPLKPTWAVGTGTTNMAPGTSIFDPTLCEVLYSWFAPVGGAVLDPFAGGSVRGIIASKLGLAYTGVELSKKQVEANRVQADEICEEKKPNWIIGDSNKKIPTDKEFDFVFSCPPYANLEVYSDDEDDISNMEYNKFVDVYSSIIKKSVDQLKEDRFACFVVGEVRDKKGNYYNFIGDTIKAFLDAGVSYYNEIILVTAVGSLPIRVGKQFNSGRKIGKTHQNVLVFYKGNPKNIKKNFGKLDLSNVDFEV